MHHIPLSIFVQGLALCFLSDAAVTGWHQLGTEESHCPPVDGNFSINNFQLYPENAAWDPVGCKFYAGADFNASVLVYDPYTADYQILKFPGITNTQPYHISGIDYDASSGSMFFCANSGLGFQTNGEDLSGPNKIIKWDTRKMEVVFIADLAPVQQEYQNKFGHVAAGFQDMAEDIEGNSYSPTSFGGEAIAKIWTNGSVDTFYLSNTTAKNATANPYLYGGIISLPLHNKLVITDIQQGTFVTFNTKSSLPHPTTVKISNMPSNYTSIACDAIITPTRYPSQQIILCAEDFLGGNGAVTVFRSRDNWESAEYLGAVFNELKGRIVVTPLEISNNIYYLPFAPFDGGSFDSLGNRSSFPIVEITEQVDKIVARDDCQ